MFERTMTTQIPPVEGVDQSAVPTALGDSGDGHNLVRGWGKGQ
jgi:hypothetical protein